MFFLLAVHFIILHGPGGQYIEINPEAVVSLRIPRGNEHFHKEIKCLIYTTDGKFTSVTESCKEVQKLIVSNGGTL